MLKLITFRFSHYCEKVRWALDRLAVPYREIACLPLLHIPIVLAHTHLRFRGRADAISSPFSTPILIDHAGRSVHDSSRIIDWICREITDIGPWLSRGPEDHELERHFSRKLGDDTRRIAYDYLLPDAEGLCRLAERNASPLQARLFKRMLPLFQKSVARGLHVHPAAVAASRERVMRELDAVEARLRDGRPYLTGERFGIADLTFASLLSPLLLVQPREGFGGQLPSIDEVPEDFRVLVHEVRARTAGRFALRLFGADRGLRACR